MSVGLILGTGFEKMFKEAAKKCYINTPYGRVQGLKGKINEVEVLIIPRHGFKHENPPHRVNYRANMYAFRKSGVLKVVSTSAAGAINPLMKPGDLVLVDQFIDFTKSRTYTYYDRRTVHVDLTEPYSPILRDVLLRGARKLGIKVWDRGVYVCTEGPRFETEAEISMFRLFGADVVGMTNVPEVVLARELGISYATIVIVTNFAAGIQKEVSHKEVLNVVEREMETVRKLVYESIPIMEEVERDSVCVKMDEIVRNFWGEKE